MAITNATGLGEPGILPGDPGSTYNRIDGPPYLYRRFGTGWVVADVLDDDGMLSYDCIPMGSTSDSVCVGNDSRLSNARTPTAHTHVIEDITDYEEGGGPHNTTHQNGGADELNVGGLSGVLAEPQTPIAHAAQHVTGNDVIPNAGANPGLMSSSDKSKLDGVQSGATVNDTDANLKNRANHTGTQAQSTVTNLVGDLGGKQASLGFTPENAANKNAASGYPGLDGSSKLAGTQQTYGSAANTACQGNDSRLSDARTPLAHTHALADITDEGALASKNTIATNDIDNNAVTNTKAAQMATKTYKGRTSAATGNAEDVAVATLKTDLVLVKADVGLGSVDNTADSAKPVSSAQQTALNLKTDLSVLNTFLSSYRTILQANGSHIAGRVAGTYGIPTGQPLAITGTGTLYALSTIHIVGADYPTVNGLAAKLRIRWQLFANDVAPFTGTFIVGLHPITRPGTSGGAGLCIYTIGAAVSGSTNTFTNVAADSSNGAAGSDFSLPSDGHYVIGVVTSAAMAANSHAHISAILQLRNA